MVDRAKIGENALTLLILAGIGFLVYMRVTKSNLKESIQKIKEFFKG